MPGPALYSLPDIFIAVSAEGFGNGAPARRPLSEGREMPQVAFPSCCLANLDSIFKSRDITLPTKVHLVKAMVFPVVMYGCENWTIMKAEHRRIDQISGSGLR